VNQAVCKEKYKDSSQGLIEGQICAGYSGGSARLVGAIPSLAGMVDACHGDSGGPLACKVGGHYDASDSHPTFQSPDGSYKLVGVVNWSRRRCGEVNTVNHTPPYLLFPHGLLQPGNLGVYTRVQHYQEWIQHKIDLDNHVLTA
jgi:secreted trypsin-like serine protease